MLMIAMQYTSNPGTYAFIRLQESYFYSQSLIVICRSLCYSVAFSVEFGLWALNVSLVVFSVPLSAFGVSHEIQAGSMEGMHQFFMSFWRFFQKHFSMTLITVFLKDLLYVISYGPSQVKPPAVQMLFHYWPNLKPPGAISEYRGLQYTGEMFDSFLQTTAFKWFVSMNKVKAITSACISDISALWFTCSNTFG